MCSIANPVAALEEMTRVIKERAEVRLLEHVLSQNGFVAFLEHVHNALTRHLFRFNVNRDTISNIRKAGFNGCKRGKPLPWRCLRDSNYHQTNPQSWDLKKPLCSVEREMSHKERKSINYPKNTIPPIDWLLLKKLRSGE